MLVLSAPVASAVVRFLLDRLDEDYDELDRVGRAERSTDHANDYELQSVVRLRAEIIAKRHVIGDLQQLLVLRDQPFEEPVRRTASVALRAMTAPYAAHPRFQEKWLLPEEVRVPAP